MEEETRRRIGIGLAILGFIIIVINGVLVIGHYLVGWAIPSIPSFAIGVVLLVVGLMTARKRQI
jgi:hypothetical protein